MGVSEVVVDTREDHGKTVAEVSKGDHSNTEAFKTTIIGVAGVFTTIMGQMGIGVDLIQGEISVGIEVVFEVDGIKIMDLTFILITKWKLMKLMKTQRSSSRKVNVER